mgnify:FL=1
MKQIVLLFLLFFSLDICSQECTEFFLIRHAEKDRSDLENKNPNLNEKGKLRALKWVEILDGINFDKIYSTNYNRTIQTVSPISKKLNIDVSIYSPSALSYKDFILKNYGNKVLVVGHSNTIPGFVNGLINEKVYEQINDLNNSNLYSVTICDEAVVHNLLYIN